MKCSFNVNEELDWRSVENLPALFVPTATHCCDTAVTSPWWCFLSSSGCRLRFWTRLCPTLTSPPFTPSVSPTSSSIGLPTRSKCGAVKVNISALPERNGLFLTLSLQRTLGQDLRSRVQEGPKDKAKECWGAAATAAGSADGLSGGAWSATGILEDGVLQVCGCTWLQQVEEASKNNQQLHRTSQSNRARATVGKWPLVYKQ